MDDDVLELFEDAIEKYGVEAQKNQAIEECLELALALRRHLRFPHNDEHAENVIDEIADGIIMLGQMSIIYGMENVEKRINYKCERLQKRLDMTNNDLS